MSWRSGIGASGLVLSAVFLGHGGASAQTTAPANLWNTQCTAPDQTSPLACSAEQRVILRETGQQIARFSVQASGPKAERRPAFLIQLPLGLSIRNGVQLLVDDREVARLDLQTCDAGGCFSGDALGPELLQALRSGKAMKIQFTDLQKKTISVQIDLTGFSAAIDKIR